MQIQWQLIRRPCSRICLPSSKFFTVSIVRNSGWVMVSRRRAAGNPRYSTAKRSPFTPAAGTHARSVIVRKTMQLFRANVDSGGLSIKIRCCGTRSGGSTRLCRLRTRLSSLHFAPLLIHSRSIIPKAETPRMYLRDTLIYPALVSLSLRLLYRTFIFRTASPCDAQG